MKILLSFSFLFFSIGFFPYKVLAVENILIVPFTVEPPSVNAYLKNSLPNILASRISNASIKIIPAPATISTVQKMFTEVSADYIMTGTVVTIGTTLSVDLALYSKNGTVQRYNVSSTVKTLLADVDKLAATVQKAIVDVASAPSRIKLVTQDPSLVPLEAKSIWKTSKAIPIEARGLRIEDLDNDGTQEIILLGADKIIIYAMENGTLVEKAQQKFPIRINAKYLAVASAIKGKDKQILVTAMIENRLPSSFIFSYSKGKLNVVQSKINYLLGAYYNAPEKRTVPILQAVYSYPASFFQAPVHTFALEGGKIKKGGRLTPPLNANLFSFTTIPTEKGIRTLVLRPTEQIAYFLPKQKSPLYSTPDRYSSTTYFMSLIPENVINNSSEIEQELYYIPTHFVTIPSTKDAVLLFAANAEDRGRFSTGYRTYSRYTIQALSFTDASSMIVWTSPLINATVADFDIADVDNDGVRDLFVLTGPSSTSSPTFKTKNSYLLRMPIITE